MHACHGGWTVRSYGCIRQIRVSPKVSPLGRVMPELGAGFEGVWYTYMGCRLWCPNSTSGQAGEWSETGVRTCCCRSIG